MPQAAQLQMNAPAGATPRPLQSPRANKPTSSTESTTGATPQTSPATANNNTPQIREPRISNIEVFKMVAAGILFDLIALIPVVGGYGAEVFGGMTFFLWFLILGLPLMSPKTIANWGLNLFVGESVTAGVWPGFTVGIILTIIMTRIEDATGLEVMSLVKGDVKSLSAVKENLSTQIKARMTNNTTPQQGATPEPRQETPKINPVIASQQEHFADPSTPSIQGATQPPQPRGGVLPQRRQSNPRDEEVATSLNSGQPEKIFSPDPYQENPFSLEPFEGRPANDNTVGGSGQPSKTTAPFPGTSPQFGQGSRQQARDTVAKRGTGKLLNFDVKRKENTPSQETERDKTPTGATPNPKSVNDSVS